MGDSGQIAREKPSFIPLKEANMVIAMSRCMDYLELEVCRFDHITDFLYLTGQCMSPEFFLIGIWLGRLLDFVYRRWVSKYLQAIVLLESGITPDMVMMIVSVDQELYPFVFQEIG